MTGWALEYNALSSASATWVSTITCSDSVDSVNTV